MTLLEQLLQKLRFRRESGMQQYKLDERLHSLIEEMAEKENRPEQEITARLLESALQEHGTSQDMWKCWQTLSHRQQEVTALFCLGYSTLEIATKLDVSINTVKTYLRNILKGFDLNEKTELLIALRDWDFSAWDKQSHR